MTMETAPSDQAPAWFSSAISHVPEHRNVEVEGARVHLRCWGDEGKPGLLFVHGGGAHSGWWDHIAPFFDRTHRVVAVDLTGHGDSDHRRAYRTDQWATEALLAAAAGGITGLPYVVGHSMGGFVTATIGIRSPTATRGQMIIDSPLDHASPEESRLRRPRKVYTSTQEIRARFTLTPPQDVLLPYIGGHIAAQSVRQTDDGWIWKFDAELFQKHTKGGVFSLRNLLPQLHSPTVYLRSEHGLVTNEMAAEINRLTGSPVRMVELPDAGHHPMMDQPLPLIAAIRTVLALRDLARN